MMAGRCVASITLAMVKVLPEPVTPSSTCSRSPASAWATSSAMAEGWSPAGWYFVSSRKGMRFLLVGRSGRWGTQSAGAAGASSGVRRGPLTGANIGARPWSKATGASLRPGLGVWTGLVGFAGERAMNIKVMRARARR